MANKMMKTLTIGENTYEIVDEQARNGLLEKSDSDHIHTAEDVGADASGSAASALTDAKSYTDISIANLINGAPTTLDTLKEIADAMEENADVVEALENAIGTKADATNLTAHIEDKNNPHGVTAEQVGAEVSGAASAALNEAKAYTDEKLSQISFDDISTPDWNAPEGAAGHILNRTHYVEESVYLEETTYRANGAIRVPSEPVIGETYNVYRNGIKYECVCYEGDLLNERIIPTLAGKGPNGDESYPFTILSLNPYSITVGDIKDDLYSGTIAITTLGNVHKLDPKFLPESLENWTNVNPDDFASNFAPSGLVTGYYTASTDEQIDSILKTVLESMEIRTQKIIVLYLDSSDNTLVGGTWFITINKTSDEYSTFNAESYMGGAIVKRLTRTVYGGTYNSWVRDDPTAFAPSGYGLGETMYSDAIKVTRLAEVDALVHNGWYQFYGELDEYVNGYGYCAIHVTTSRYQVMQTQYAYHPSIGFRIATRVQHEGVWGGWINRSPSAFAPSGYGLGDICTTLSANEITKTGWYKGSIGNVTGDTWGANADFWIIRHIEHGVRNEATQKAWMPACYGNCSIERVRSEGVWGEWEWVNPRLELGVEYRTTERYQGNPVYVKLIDAGILPNNSTKYVESAIVNGITKVVDVRLNMYSGSGMAQRTNDSRIIATVNVESPFAWLAITANEDFSTYTGQVVVKYIK